MPQVWTPGKPLLPYPLQRVTVLGMGMSIISYLQAMYGNDYYGPGVSPEREVWTANWGGLIFKADLYWNTHDMLEEAEKYPHLSEAWKKLSVPLVTTVSHDEYPTAVSYPLVEMINYYGDTWFGHQFSYMVAFAQACFDLRKREHAERQKGRRKKEVLKAPEFAMYGCDFHYNVRGRYGPGASLPGNPRSPWEEGKDNLTWWLQKMYAKGTLLHIPHSSTVLDMHKRFQGELFYGYKPDQCPEIYKETDEFGLVQIRAKERIKMEDVEKSISDGQAEAEQKP